ncbi:hypothetical protein [Fodinicola acaciae]|uniref:hypothetical protein n=1 Tax=Fodinicola acaciae TaxID=2681555 RepID=UPI0013D31D20|nr:hypothetical protein [Fodinicola acaciae]
MVAGSVRTASSEPPEQTRRPRAASLRWLAIAAWVAAGVLFLPAVVQTLQRRWAGDAFLHAAVIRDIAANPLHPHEPIIGGPQESPYITPVSLVIGWLVRLVGGSGYDGLTMWAVLNTVLLVAGFVLLCRAITRQPLAAPLALIFTMLLWGSRTWIFSGVLAMNSLGFVLPYPSTTGLALLLLHWAVFLHFLRKRSWWLLGLLVVITVMIATVHAFSAACDAIGLLLILLQHRKKLDWKVAGLLAGGVVVAGVLTLLWPYYSVLKLSNAGPAYSLVHQQLYVATVSRGWLILLCAPLLARRWWRDRLDPFALGFLVAVAIYLAGGLTGQFAFGRIITLVAVCAHVGAALEIADWLAVSGFPLPGRLLPVPVAGVAMAVLTFGCCIGFAGSGDGLVQAVSRGKLPGFVRQGAQRVPDVSQFGYLDRAFGEGDVVLASQWRIAVPALANGAILVVSPYPDAFTPDDAVRRAAVARFFSASASAAQRSAVIAKYHVKWVLWGTVDGPPPAALGAPAGTGPDKSRLYRVSAETFH